MKHLRQYIRKLITEAVGDKYVEAAYAILYVKGYVGGLEYSLSNSINSNPEIGHGMAEQWIPLSDAVGDIHAALNAAESEIKDDLPEKNDILREAYISARSDWSDNVYSCFENLNSFIHQATPIGMAAAEALAITGGEGGGVPVSDNNITGPRSVAFPDGQRRGFIIS